VKIYLNRYKIYSIALYIIKFRTESTKTYFWRSETSFITTRCTAEMH